MKKLVFVAAVVLAFVATRGHFAARSLPEGPRLPEDDLIRTVSTGERVDLEDLLDHEEWTLVQFTAAWCPGCRQLEPELERRIRQRGSVRLLRVDIREWDSPVARQHGIRSIPQLWLHRGADRVATDTRKVMRMLEP